MPRPRSLPDDTIFAALRQLLAGGEKAVSFASVARATGLAQASLVQRYGSRDGMVRAAMAAAWDMLDHETAKAVAATETAHGLLKALAGEAEAADLALLAIDMRDPVLRRRAEAWRGTVEGALAARMGDAEGAAMLFAAWQGQMLWLAAGGKGFRLKDAAKRLG